VSLLNPKETFTFSFSSRTFQGYSVEPPILKIKVKGISSPTIVPLFVSKTTSWSLVIVCL